MHPSLESERRSFSRIEINSRIRYRLAGEESFKEGILDNASASGVLLWTAQEDIPVGTKIIILVEPDISAQPPIEIAATVVRSVSTADTPYRGYGCQIEEATNF